MLQAEVLAWKGGSEEAWCGGSAARRRQAAAVRAEMPDEAARRRPPRRPGEGSGAGEQGHTPQNTKHRVQRNSRHQERPKWRKDAAKASIRWESW